MKFVKDSKGEKIAVCRGLAWSGVYDDGMLGWLTSNFVSQYPASLSEEQRTALTVGQTAYYPSDMYRVKITIEPVKDKNGRFIVKRNPNKNENNY